MAREGGSIRVEINLRKNGCASGPRTRISLPQTRVGLLNVKVVRVGTRDQRIELGTAKRPKPVLRNGLPAVQRSRPRAPGSGCLDVRYGGRMCGAADLSERQHTSQYQDRRASPRRSAGTGSATWRHDHHYATPAAALTGTTTTGNSIRKV